MASRRQLKQDIKEIVYDIVEGAYSFMLYHPNVQDDKVDEIIDAADELMQTLLFRVNNTPPVKNSKELKEHFSLLKKELLEEAYSLHSRINQLSA